MDANININNVEIDLISLFQEARLLPVIRRISVKISDDCFYKYLQSILSSKAGLLPVEIIFDKFIITAEGAELIIRVKKSFMWITSTVLIRAEVFEKDRILVDISNVKALGVSVEKLLSPIIESIIMGVIKKPGIELDPVRPRALRIAPEVVLESHGVPVRLAPDGEWSLTSDQGSITVEFTS